MVAAVAACLLYLGNATGIADGTPFQEPLEQLAECAEQYLDDEKEREEFMELAEVTAEADEQAVAELSLEYLTEDVIVVYVISVRATIAEEF